MTALPPQFNLMKREAVKRPHPRDAEIDAAQPPMKTVPANGAAYVRSWGGQEGN